MKCPKCKHEQKNANAIECEQCGIIFEKYYKAFINKKFNEAVKHFEDGDSQNALKIFKSIIKFKPYQNKELNITVRKHIKNIEESLGSTKNRPHRENALISISIQVNEKILLVCVLIGGISIGIIWGIVTGF